MLISSPFETVTSSASPFTARPEPARVDSEISKVTESAPESPVIVRFEPVAVKMIVSVVESAAGSVPSSVSKVAKVLVPAPVESVEHSQTLVESFHLSISLAPHPWSKVSSSEPAPWNSKLSGSWFHLFHLLNQEGQ